MEHVRQAAEQAIENLANERQKYGDTIDSANRTATLWTALFKAHGFDVTVTEEMVREANVLQNMARAIAHGYGGVEPVNMLTSIMGIVNIEHAAHDSYSRKVVDPMVDSLRCFPDGDQQWPRVSLYED